MLISFIPQVFIVTKIPPTEMGLNPSDLLVLRQGTWVWATIIVGKGTDETYAAVMKAVEELGTPVDLVRRWVFSINKKKLFRVPSPWTNMKKLI